MIGGSCGTAVKAALTVASELTEDDMVVVLLPDSGRGYLSKIFNDDWMATYGFLSKDGVTVRDILDSKNQSGSEIIHVQPDDTVADALSIMNEHEISQVIVAQGALPISAAEVKGTLTTQAVFDSEDEATKSKVTCSMLMDGPLQYIGIGQSADVAKTYLENGEKLLVLDQGKPRGVLTLTDYIRFLGK